MVNRRGEAQNAIFLAILPLVYDLKRSEALFASLDSLIAPTICSDAYMSRTSDFSDDDRQRQTKSTALPLAAHGRTG